MTDHSIEIEQLRSIGGTENELAADLLEMHDRTSLSLDNWHSARTFVTERIRTAMGVSYLTIEENHV